MAGQNPDLVAMFSCNCHCNGMPGLGRETPHDRAIMGASRDHLMPLINQTQEISISFALFRSPILSARLSMNMGDVKGVEELIYCGTASDSEIREGVQCSCNQGWRDDINDTLFVYLPDAGGIRRLQIQILAGSPVRTPAGRSPQPGLRPGTDLQLSASLTLSPALQPSFSTSYCEIRSDPCPFR